MGIYILLLIIAAVSHWSWSNSFSILTAGDWGYQSTITLREFLALPQLWTNTSLGSINIAVSFYPFQFLYGLLAHANVDYGLVERIVFLWPIIIATALFSYILIRKNIQSSLASFVGSLVYSYNTYFLSIQGGHLTLMFAFACAPLALFFFQKILETKKIFYVLIAALTLFIISFYEFRAFYIIVFVLGFYYLFYQFILDRQLDKKILFKNAFYALLPLVLVALLNLYWLLGFSKMGTLATNEIFSRSLFGNEFLNVLYAFTLFHPFWTGAETTEFIQQSIPFYFWLIPFSAIAGLYLNRKNPRIVFFGFIALLGILLTKQVGQPFSDLYLWLYDHFPGFNAYREASKFFFLIALGYSVLIAAFIDWMWKNWKIGKLRIFVKYATTAILIILFLWNTKPLITGEMRTLFVPRYVPEDYKIVNNFINNQDTYFRTLWVPTSPRWADYTNNHPEVSAVDQINGLWKSSISSEKKLDKYTEAELMIKSLQKEDSNALLDQSSIKYVIVPLRDIQNDDEFFHFYGMNRDYYIKQLDKLSYLHRVSINTKEVVVYENKDYLPHISVEQNGVNKMVKYTAVSATEYNVTLSHVKAPLSINFAESYHPQWKLHIGDFNWFSVLSQPNYFLDEKLHAQKDYLNTYAIDPNNTCQKFTCIKNSDGTYTMNITLYFEPQAYTYVGGIVSSLTLVLIISYLIYILILSLVRHYGKK